MKNLFQSIIAIILLLTLSAGLTIFISRREEFKASFEATAWSSEFLNKDSDVKNLSPLPDVFPGVPTPPSATGVITENSNTEHQKYLIDKYFNIVPENRSANKKVVLLTIDDGPSSSSTLDPILKTLSEYKIHALFFVMGSKANANQTLMKKIIDAGHTIGNHTYTHANLKNLSQNGTRQEIDRADTTLTKILGFGPKFFRPPYGSYNNFVKSYVGEKKMLFMNWSLGGEDWITKYQSADSLSAHVLAGLAPGSVILLHEHPWTRDALESIIVGINNRGYTFVDPTDIVIPE